MSKIIVALGLVFVGALVMFLFGSQLSIFVQPSLAQRGIVFEGAEPTVPPLRGNIVSNSSFINVIQPLDGLDCRDCTFQNVTFEYSGGAYNLVNARISLPMRIVLKGAAANTAGLLAFVESINTGAKPKPFEPNKPLLRMADNKQIMTVDFISPYGQK